MGQTQPWSINTAPNPELGLGFHSPTSIPKGSSYATFPLVSCSLAVTAMPPLLYSLTSTSPTDVSSPHALTSTTTSTVWHRRLGHQT
jgi:MFS superfamily sulfate permease-like transporter